MREFWESRKQDADIAKRDLSTWIKMAKNAAWPNFGSLKQTFASADRVGSCTVFDVGNNRFRLIGRINFQKGIIYVLRVMDHMEYDKKLWVDDCGCHKPAPGKVPTKKATKGLQPRRPTGGPKRNR